MLIPNDMIHHANMLADHVRLEAYRKALLAQVNPSDNVVDIGTGTGILASYAATMTKGRVYGIEYYEQSAKVASKLVKKSGTSNLAILNSSSYGAPVKDSVDLMVTETIGAIGPEENIVELCYEFKRRYPEIKTIIPATLTMYALPIFSQKLRSQLNSLVEAYIGASHQGLDFSLLEQPIRNSFCQTLLGDDLSQSETFGCPQELVKYHLGSTSNSEFCATVPLREFPEANAVHLYFEANLGGGVKLVSNIGSPLTHWKHRAIYRPESRDALQISWNPRRNQFSFSWEG